MDKLSEILNSTGKSILYVWEQNGREPQFVDIPTMETTIANYLRTKFGGRIYTHQGVAIEAALRGDDVALSTGTASGKTICFSVPVFHELLTNPDATAIFLYPTKALAGDQIAKLLEMAEATGCHGLVYRFDGDTSAKERQQALRYGRLLIGTPDVLHSTLLRRNKEKEYAEFFRRLKTVVLDECHVYRGAFGSNLAMVLRRLTQVCRNKGATFRFLAASATSKDPASHLRLLTGREFTVVNEAANGSPSGGRRFIMLNSGDDNSKDELINEYGLMAELARSGKRFITFCHSRRLTESVFQDLTEQFPDLIGQVMPYRSGYEPEDRRQIEQALRQGSLKGVISTSALELGVDLPDMEYCLLLGLPSTVMSFWQRVGRVGRQQNLIGKVIMIPMENAIDSYYFLHPERLAERSLEPLPLHLDNRPLLLSHFACARQESDDYQSPRFDVDIFGSEFVSLKERVDSLDIVDEILHSPDPHSQLNLRGIDDETYEIVGGGGVRIGTIQYSQVLREAYPDAVYRHMGNGYRVERLSTKDKIVRVKGETGSRRTSPVGYLLVRERNGVGQLAYRRTTWGNSVTLTHSPVTVVTTTSGYREKSGGSWIQRAYPVPLQRRVFSEGVWLRFGTEFGPVTRAGLNAFVHALSIIYTIENPCDVMEIATYTVVKRNDGGAAVYVFDTTAGGLGLSAGVFDCFEELLPAVRERLSHCSCCDPDNEDRGCPACIQVQRGFEDNDSLSKKSAFDILFRLEMLLKQHTPLVEISDAYSARLQGKLTSIGDDQNSHSGEDGARELFGRLLFEPGCIVKMPTGVEVLVEKFTRENDNNVSYSILMPDERSIRVRDMGMKWISGPFILQCTNCGWEAREKVAVCPECHADLM